MRARSSSTRKPGRDSLRPWIDPPGKNPDSKSSLRNPASLNRADGDPKTKTPLSGVEPISSSHDVSRFDCGKHSSLNDWLKRFALANERNESARTYVVHRNGFVAGYYSISTGSVSVEQVPSRISKGLARHPVPVILLARLAVDKNEQGAGLGKALLKDALARIGQAADIVGARAVLVHAIDEQARRFYEHFDFEPSPVDDLHLMLLMKDLRKALEERRDGQSQRTERD